jgi:hypothetical protein
VTDDEPPRRHLRAVPPPDDEIKAMIEALGIVASPELERTLGLLDTLDPDFMPVPPRLWLHRDGTPMTADEVETLRAAPIHCLDAWFIRQHRDQL